MNVLVAMTAAQIAMLSGGVVLLVVALGLLIFLVVTGKSAKGVLILFPVAIIMIGFPSFTHVEVLGVTFDEAAATQYAQNPNDPAAIANYQQALGQLQKEQQSHPGQPLPSNVRQSLTQTVTRLSAQPKLTPESRLALSQTRAILAKSK